LIGGYFRHSRKAGNSIPAFFSFKALANAFEAAVRLEYWIGNKRDL